MTLGANWIAYRRSFYCWPKPSKSPIKLTIRQLFFSFAIYLTLTMAVAPFIAKFALGQMQLIDPSITTLSISSLSTIQLSFMIFIFLCLMTYLYISNPAALRLIWKDKSRPHQSSLFDWGIGAMTWLLSFPLVTLISELCDLLINHFFGVQTYEQTAVRYVKMAMESPLSLITALLSVIIMAPLIEELLFRGVLFTFLKQRFGFKSGLILSALIFSLFHFSPSQGLGNVTLLISLFILGGFLAFLYERQGSLLASIGLHMSFNTISALRILFLPEGN